MPEESPTSPPPRGDEPTVQPIDELISEIKQSLQDADIPSDYLAHMQASEEVIKKILPILFPTLATMVQKNQEVRDQTGEKLRTLSEKIIIAPTDTDDVWRFLGDVEQGIYDATWIEKGMKEMQKHWLFGPILTILIGAVHVITTITNYASVSAEKTRQIAQRDIKPFLLDLDTLLKEVYRNPNNYKWVWDQLDRMGIDEEKRDRLIHHGHVPLALDMLRVLWKQEKIDVTDFEQGLREIGIDPDNFEKVKEGLELFPGIDDEIRFGVRDVHNPEAVELGELFSGLPPELMERGRKLGMSEESLKFYWGAHWNPPSIGAATEMLHRGVITNEEYFTLLKINDVMPGMLDKLQAISYSPFTRVDARRMYEDGVIDFERLVQAYADLGYTIEDATLISEWVDRRWGEEAKERTKTDVMSLYKAKIFSRDQTLSQLREVGYREEIAQEFILREDLKIAEKKNAAKLKLWEKGFVNDILTETDVRSKMSAIGMSAGEIDDIISDWEIVKASKIKLLSKDDLKLIAQKGVLTPEEVKERLVKIGYTEGDAQLLILAWGG